MSGGTYIRVDVGCPFFKTDDGKLTITCEGVTDGSFIIQRFLRKSDWECQTRTFCCEHYKKCEIYRMLMEYKYGEEEL